MSVATISIALPTTRKDGSAFSASNYGGAHVFRDGAVVAILNSPDLVAADAGVVPGASVYTVSIFDTQTPPVSSDLSPPVTAPSIAGPPAPLAAPGAPTIAVTVT